MPNASDYLPAGAAAIDPNDFSANAESDCGNGSLSIFIFKDGDVMDPSRFKVLPMLAINWPQGVCAASAPGC